TRSVGLFGFVFLLWVLSKYLRELGENKTRFDSDCCCGLKCCSNGCGYECMIPLTVYVSGVPVKPGYCGPWTAGNFCKDDGYCSGDQKCCPSYCGKKAKPEKKSALKN
uniref:WAP domain-containing protein n=1 Tax=Poecilia reticulata TaxID=8081 RepID=A0A3P9Q496_POERE